MKPIIIEHASSSRIGVGYNPNNGLTEYKGPGFTLAHLDPFQRTMRVDVRRAVFEGICGKPSRSRVTKLKLVTFLTRGWML